MGTVYTYPKEHDLLTGLTLSMQKLYLFPILFSPGKNSTYLQNPGNWEASLTLKAEFIHLSLFSQSIWSTPLGRYIPGRITESSV